MAEEAPGNRAILIVEDSDEDFKTLLWIFKKLGIGYPLQRCRNGDEALAFLASRQGPGLLPFLILLDLNLPGVDGREILRQIKRNDSFRAIPLVVITTNSNPKDVRECYLNGANSYILKPVNLDRFKSVIQTLVSYWCEAVILPEPV